MTTNVSIIDPAGGGDYTTLAAWESATDYDLVASGNMEIAQISGNLSERFTIGVAAVATTNASFHRVVTPHPSMIMTTPTSGTLDGITCSGTDGYVDEDYVHLSGLKFEEGGAETLATFINIGSFGTDRPGLVIDGCGFYGNINNGGTNGAAIQVIFSSDFAIHNCWINKTKQDGIYLQGTPSGRIYNTTIDSFNLSSAGSVAGIWIADGSKVDVRNTMITRPSGSSICIREGLQGDFGSTNNITSDATSIGANATTGALSYDDYYTDYLGSPVDLTIKDVSSIQVGAGITISSFSNDVLQASRPQGSVWDVGFNELILVAVSPTPVVVSRGAKSRAINSEDIHGESLFSEAYYVANAADVGSMGLGVASSGLAISGDQVEITAGLSIRKSIAISNQGADTLFIGPSINSITNMYSVVGSGGQISFNVTSGVKIYGSTDGTPIDVRIIEIG